MADKHDLLMDLLETYGYNYSILEPDWNLHEEFVAAKPITKVELFPRSSTPIQNEVNPTLPSSSSLNGYEEFNYNLNQLPENVKVRGVKVPPKCMINGNLMSNKRSRRLKEPTFKALMQFTPEQLEIYVQCKHPKCQKTHSFNDKKKLSPISRTAVCSRLPYEESELKNTIHRYSPSQSLPAITNHHNKSILDLPNYSDIRNEEDTPPFNMEAFINMEYVASKSEITEYPESIDWSSERTDTASYSQLSEIRESDVSSVSLYE